MAITAKVTKMFGGTYRAEIGDIWATAKTRAEAIARCEEAALAVLTSDPKPKVFVGNGRAYVVFRDRTAWTYKSFDPATGRYLTGCTICGTEDDAISDVKSLLA